MKNPNSWEMLGSISSHFVSPRSLPTPRLDPWQPCSQGLLRFQDGHLESGVDPGNEVESLVYPPRIPIGLPIQHGGYQCG